jgi:hypothetical protein
MVMALCGTFSTSLYILALESLISNLLTVVALHQLGLVFKGAGYARLSPCVKEPLG